MLMHSCAHALLILRVCVHEHVYDYYTMCPPRLAHVRACVWGTGGHVHTFYNDNQEGQISCSGNAVMRHHSRAKRTQYATVLLLLLLLGTQLSEIQVNISTFCKDEVIPVMQKVRMYCATIRIEMQSTYVR